MSPDSSGGVCEVLDKLRLVHADVPKCSRMLPPTCRRRFWRNDLISLVSNRPHASKSLK